MANFTSVELPGLSQVKGAFNVQSSGQLDCTAFDADNKSKHVIKGNYVCQGAVSKPGGAGTKPSSTGSSSSSSAAAGNLQIPASIISGTGLFAMFLQMFL